MSGANDPLLKLNNNFKDGICPFLGLASDSETCYVFPNRGNYCYRVDTAQPVSFAHQEKMCLGEEYPQCPVYRDKGETPFPSELRGEGLDPDFYKRFSWWKIGLVVIVSAATFAFLWFKGMIPISPTSTPSLEMSTQTKVYVIDNQEAETLFPPQEESTPLPSSFTLTPTITLTSTLTLTPTITLTSSITPTPTDLPTITPTPGPVFGTPFGDQKQYVLHNVIDGDSLGNLAYLYDTSVEAIRKASDIRSGKDAWPGDLLVIPIGQSDPSQVTCFMPLYLERKTSIYDLSARYAVTVKDIRFYNDLGDDEYIPAGRWLIIPVCGE